MADSILDQLSELSDEELELLKTVSRKGAATADEVALRLDRPGDDTSLQMDRLVAHVPVHRPHRPHLSHPVA